MHYTTLNTGTAMAVSVSLSALVVRLYRRTMHVESFVRCCCMHILQFRCTLHTQCNVIFFFILARLRLPAARSHSSLTMSTIFLCLSHHFIIILLLVLFLLLVLLLRCTTYAACTDPSERCQRCVHGTILRHSSAITTQFFLLVSVINCVHDETARAIRILKTSRIGVFSYTFGVLYARKWGIVCTFALAASHKFSRMWAWELTTNTGE